MVPLPIDPFLPQITANLAGSRALVLVAEPGAGKTTRVPPAILRAGLLGKDHPNLVMLQPRRVAARASAQRIADENGWELGREVGYHVRFDRKIGPQTRLPPCGAGGGRRSATPCCWWSCRPPSTPSRWRNSLAAAPSSASPAA